MPGADVRSLWGLTEAAGFVSPRVFADSNEIFGFDALAQGTTLGIAADELRDRSVMICARRQLAAAQALIELDGIARRIVLCPPDIAPAQLPEIMAQAGVELVFADQTTQAAGLSLSRCGLPLRPSVPRPAVGPASEWFLFTSGTTGQPKLVFHTLASLIAPLASMSPGAGAIWSTFYDIRRYGGLQILLRALLGGGSMVFSDEAEPVGVFLSRAADAGVTHISGTPSHWRRALMSKPARQLSPRYVRLSGEASDQAILNTLKLAYPGAMVAHAYASTEAGVGFEVDDGFAGFPAELIGGPDAKSQLRIRDGALQIKSAAAALGYTGETTQKLADADGFIDTGDLVELRDGRFFFIGRKEGFIKVGGQKVHPEEIESVINLHPAVRVSRVHARQNPITGAIVIADIVLQPDHTADATFFETVKTEIFSRCRNALPPYKVPAMLRQVTRLDLAASGKLSRVQKIE